MTRERVRTQTHLHVDKFMYQKGGLIFKYQMQLRCGTSLAERTVLLAPTPPRVDTKGILSYECMPPPPQPRLTYQSAK